MTGDNPFDEDLFNGHNDDLRGVARVIRGADKVHCQEIGGGWCRITAHFPFSRRKECIACVRESEVTQLAERRKNRKSGPRVIFQLKGGG